MKKHIFSSSLFSLRAIFIHFIRWMHPSIHFSFFVFIASFAESEKERIILFGCNCDEKKIRSDMRRFDAQKGGEIYFRPMHVSCIISHAKRVDCYSFVVVFLLLLCCSLRLMQSIKKMLFFCPSGKTRKISEDNSTKVFNFLCDSWNFIHSFGWLLEPLLNIEYWLPIWPSTVTPIYPLTFSARLRNLPWTLDLEHKALTNIWSNVSSPIDSPSHNWSLYSAITVGRVESIDEWIKNA